MLDERSRGSLSASALGRIARRGWCMALLAACSPALSTGVAHAASGVGYTVGSHLFRIDLATGEMTAVAPIDRNLFELAIDREGTLFGVAYTSRELVTLDIVTGAVTVIGSLDVIGEPGSLAFDACGRLWITAAADDVSRLYEVNPDDAATRLVGTTDAYLPAAIGGLLYGVRGDSRIVAVDPRTGSLVSTLHGSVSFAQTVLEAAGPRHLLLNECSGFVPLPTDNSVISVDVLTGEAELFLALHVGGHPYYCVSNLAIGPPAGRCERLAPEIPSLTSGGLGALMVAVALVGLRALTTRKPRRRGVQSTSASAAS